MNQSILQAFYIDFVGSRTAQLLTVSTIVSDLTSLLLGLILDQVLSESIHRVVVCLFPKAGTTRLLSIKVVQGKTAYLEVGTSILSILLCVNQRLLFVSIVDSLMLS